MELVALVCCDLAAIVRGRSLPAAALTEQQLASGVGWVPANFSLTPQGPLAAHTPFDSTGDVRLRPDPDAHARIPAGDGSSALELVLCDVVETDGRPWGCCPRSFLRAALAELERVLDARVVASFEHEFQLVRDTPPAIPFSLEAQRRAEPFAAAAMGALAEAGLEPERCYAEFAAHQLEIPLAPADGLAAADRAVLFRELVREVARRGGTRASFTPLLAPDEPGNGVHIHLSLRDPAGGWPFYDPHRPGALGELGGSFAAGVLRHAPALSALSAPSPVSAARLRPHRWGAGAACLGPRNREALLRIPALVTLGAQPPPASQLRLEYRGADSAANPHLALGAIVRAGLEGIRERLPTPPPLERDPAQLDPADAERFGVGALPASLPDALAALAADDTVRGWLGAPLYDAFVGVKRAELDAVADLDFEETCRRYAEIY